MSVEKRMTNEANKDDLDNIIDKEATHSAGLRENLYSHINVSLGTMDVIISIITVALIVFVTFGIWQATIK